MTENEAIEVLKNNYPKKCKMVNGRYQGGFDDTECDFGQALTIAISALKEIQQYRKIGASPERITELILEGSAAKRILEHYQKIGTVKECREAVKKRKDIIRKHMPGKDKNVHTNQR